MALLKPRTRSIRARIALLLAVPLLSLLGLWGFAANLTLDDALAKARLDTTYRGVGTPVLPLMSALQQERKLSAVFLASPEGLSGPAYQALAALRTQGEQYELAFRQKALTSQVRESAEPQTLEQLEALIQGLDRLRGIRESIDDKKMTPAEAIGFFSGLLDTGNTLSGTMLTANDVDLYRRSTAVISFSLAREFILREDAMVSAAIAGGGRMSRSQQQEFTALVSGHRQMTSLARSDLGAELRPIGEAILGSESYTTFAQLEDAVEQAGSAAGPVRLPATVVDGWDTATEQLVTFWGEQLNKTIMVLAEQAKPLNDQVVRRLVVAGGFGLLAVVISIVLSVLLVRGLAREIAQLQGAAWELAERRLPWVVERLRRGEEVDVAREVPPLEIGARTTEVARVADAFNRVQGTAMRTAVGEAHLRKGISRVFLNLAWRSQSLLHRQLRMLDALERKAPDPETLNDLFQLDHLTTRMRRHAEGLIILSGAAPGRSWSHPVHLADVLRGAVAEVEDYTRVEVVTNAPVALTGAAVTDVIHLLAELVENGTAYSPPPTEVLVHGEIVGNGFAVEIVDRGVGLTPEELAELNERLARAPEFDLADTDRLGLFVVSRLAARHGIRVTLQPSAYGGVSAVVVIPHSLIVPESALREEQPSIGSGPVPAVGPGPVLQGTGPQPLVPVPAPAAPMGAASAVVPPSEEGGLPRRIRQNSLAPQLRQEPLPAPAPAVAPEQAERAPEESRDLFSSLQAGWQRARNETEHEDGS